MKKPLSEKIEKLILETASFTIEEKANLIWGMLEKFKNEKVLLYQDISVTDKPGYFIVFKQFEPKPPKRKLGTWKNNITYIAPDFNEPINDLKDYM